MTAVLGTLVEAEVENPNAFFGLTAIFFGALSLSVPFPT